MVEVRVDAGLRDAENNGDGRQVQTASRQQRVQQWTRVRIPDPTQNDLEQFVRDLAVRITVVEDVNHLLA